MKVLCSKRFQKLRKSTCPSGSRNLRNAREADTPVTKMKSACVKSSRPNPVGVCPGAAKAVIECTQNTLAAVLSSGQTLNTPGERRA